MTHSTSDWATVFSAAQALAVVTIAIAAAYISYQQYRISKQKLRLDLYDRRLAVYVSVHDCIVSALNQTFTTIADDTTGKMGLRVREARFLFNAETFELLNSLETDILTYRNGVLTLKSRDMHGWTGPEAADYREHHNATGKRLLSSLSELPRKLHVYLAIDDTLSFSVIAGSNILGPIAELASSFSKPPG